MNEEKNSRRKVHCLSCFSWPFEWVHTIGPGFPKKTLCCHHPSELWGPLATHFLRLKTVPLLPSLADVSSHSSPRTSKAWDPDPWMWTLTLQFPLQVIWPVFFLRTWPSVYGSLGFSDSGASPLPAPHNATPMSSLQSFQILNNEKLWAQASLSAFVTSPCSGHPLDLSHPMILSYNGTFPMVTINAKVIREEGRSLSKNSPSFPQDYPPSTQWFHTIPPNSTDNLVETQQTIWKVLYIEVL